MNEEKNQDLLPGEVVEYYQQPDTREVVEYYVQDRPLPGRGPKAPLRHRWKRRRLGLWVFLICLVIAGGLAAAVYFWPEREAAPPAAGSQEVYDEDLTAPVKIPV